MALGRDRRIATKRMQERKREAKVIEWEQKTKELLFRDVT
jgi:hypothetical protein